MVVGDQECRPGLKEEDGDDRRRLQSKDRSGIGELLAAEERYHGPRSEGEDDRDQPAEHQRDLRRAREYVLEPAAVVACGNGHHRQDHPADEERDSSEHLDDPCRCHEEARLEVTGENRAEHDQEPDVRHRQDECRGDRKRLLRELPRLAAVPARRDESIPAHQKWQRRQAHDADGHLHGEEQVRLAPSTAHRAMPPTSTTCLMISLATRRALRSSTESGSAIVTCAARRMAPSPASATPPSITSSYP